MRNGRKEKREFYLGEIAQSPSPSAYARVRIGLKNEKKKEGDRKLFFC